MKQSGRLAVHTKMWHDEKIYGMNGGHSAEETDAYLNHKSRVSFDWIRETVGPYFVKVFRVVRDFFRWIMGSRTVKLRGLQLGVYERSKSGYEWKVHNVAPHKVTKAMVAFRGVRV
jgi:hypothetical protein